MKRYEQFKFFIKFKKKRKFKSDFPRGKMLGKFLTKKASQPHRNFVIFSKKWYQKTMISDSKTWKILKVQKWHQKASRSLLSRVMSKFWIWEFGNFRAISPGKTARYWWKRDSQHFRNVEKFSLWCVTYILRYIIYVT